MIIGIMGAKRSGKDSIADILVNTYNFKKYAYADPIKDIIKIVFGWGDERIEDKEEIDPFWGISPRQALQNIGTELFQFKLGELLPKFKNTIGRNIWVKCFETWYHNLPRNTNVVVSDIRFPHELNSLKSMGALILKVERPDLSTIDSHLSESYTAQLKYDYLITNNKDLQHIQNQIDKLMEEDY